MGGIIPPLINILKDGNMEGKERASATIARLSEFDINTGSMCERCVIEPLVEALGIENIDMRRVLRKVIDTLYNLTRVNDDSKRVIGECGAISRLMKLVGFEKACLTILNSSSLSVNRSFMCERSVIETLVDPDSYIGNADNYARILFHLVVDSDDDIKGLIVSNMVQVKTGNIQ